VELEKRGIPTVTICTEPFETMARMEFAAMGMPDAVVVVIPHPLMTRTAAELVQLARQALPGVRAGLLVSKVR
jgi:hypothetical protein